MSKVLISFVGNGRPKKDQPDKSKREYESAKYRFNDSDKIYETTFVSDAIVRHYEIKQIILIGTARSMWEEVYRVFGERKGLDILNTEPYSAIWSELGDSGPNQTYKSDATVLYDYKSKIEEILGNGSHIEIVKYGLNNEELQENTSKILSLESLLNNGDELYIDITHSFRSLPIYIINLLIYLENVSAKKLKISRILYGMFEAGREFDGVTPVVDITDIMTLNRWLMGAYALKNFGQGYQIADLIQSEDKDVANKLTIFSDYLNLNYLRGLKNNTTILESVKNKISNPIASLILTPVINDFSDEIYKYKAKTSTFQIKVARWQMKNCNYSASYMSLVESLISYVSEVVFDNVDDLDCREYSKIILGKSLSKNKPPFSISDAFRKCGLSIPNKFLVADIEVLRDVYKSANKIRNCLTHSIDRKESVADMIATLKKSIEKSEKIICR